MSPGRPVPELAEEAGGGVTPAASLLRQGIRGWRFTSHALDRMDQMNVNWETVLAVVEDPAILRDGNRTRYPEGQKIASRFDLSVVYAVADRAIITVLPWTTQDYRR